MAETENDPIFDQDPAEGQPIEESSDTTAVAKEPEVSEEEVVEQEKDERAGPKYPAGPKFEKGSPGPRRVELSQAEWDAIHKSDDPWSVFDLRGQKRPTPPSPDEAGKPRLKNMTPIGETKSLRDRGEPCPGCGTFYAWIDGGALICLGCYQPVCTIKAEVERLDAVGGA